MGTIIAHGAGHWGRSNKNRRIDSELEEELNSIESSHSVVTEEAVLLKGISEQVNIGTKIVKKMDDIPLQVPVAEPQIAHRDNSSAPTINHTIKTVEKNYKSEDIVTSVVIEEPVVDEVPQSKKPRKKKT